MVTAAKQITRQRIVGYIVVAVLIVGLVFLIYWLVTEQPGKRFRGIERLRGETTAPMPEQDFGSRQTAPVIYEGEGFIRESSCGKTHQGRWI